MIGTSDTMQPICFHYGRSLIVTWGYTQLPEGGYEFYYLEMCRDISLDDAIVQIRNGIDDQSLAYDIIDELRLLYA